MASLPPKACCYRGVKHEGNPVGKTIKVAGVDTYISEPTGSEIHQDKAILYLVDALGLYQNAQLIADQFAANGYLCIMPDLFKGDAITFNELNTIDLMAWVTKGYKSYNPHTPVEIDPIIADTIKYLKEERGIKRIGTAGYCFGAKYVARFLAEGKGVSVGVMSHPSFVSDEELAGVAVPLSIAAAENDDLFTPELRHKSEVILNKTGQQWQINLFSGVGHGFAVRSDLSVPKEKFAKEQAFFQALAWFGEHL